MINICCCKNRESKSTIETNKNCWLNVSQNGLRGTVELSVSVTHNTWMPVRNPSKAAVVSLSKKHNSHCLVLIDSGNGFERLTYICRIDWLFFSQSNF